MDFIQHIYTLPTKTRKIYKLIEKFERKLLRNKWSSTFKEMCLQKEILLNYTKIKYIIKNEVFKFL